MASRILLIIFCLFSQFSYAEYRVFLLKISKKTANEQSNTPTDFRLVESTLDPEQYRFFYPVGKDEEITYTETWRCYGRTDNYLPHCPNPKGQITQLPPTSP